jgi:hypothetical protein
MGDSGLRIVVQGLSNGDSEAEDDEGRGAREKPPDRGRAALPGALADGGDHRWR